MGGKKPNKKRNPKLVFEENFANKIAADFMSMESSSFVLPLSVFFSQFCFKHLSPFFLQYFIILLFASRNIFNVSGCLCLHIYHCALFFPFSDVCNF